MELLRIEFERIDNEDECLNVLTMEMSVHIDNQPFKVIYKQQGQKQ